MSTERDAKVLAHLQGFLRGIQKPGRPLESIGIDEPLVASGLVDSLAVMQIVVADGRLTLDQGVAIEKATRINFIRVVNLPSAPNASPNAPTCWPMPTRPSTRRRYSTTFTFTSSRRRAPSTAASTACRPVTMRGSKAGE